VLRQLQVVCGLVPHETFSGQVTAQQFNPESSTRLGAAALIQAQHYVIMSLILRPKQDDVSRFAGAKSSSSRCTFEAESAIWVLLSAFLLAECWRRVKDAKRVRNFRGRGKREVWKIDNRHTGGAEWNEAQIV
jgi:hypothetical protein